MMKKHLLEAATLIAAALVCALIANAVASRERKVAIVGDYPNALTVPNHIDQSPAPPVETADETAVETPRLQGAPPISPAASSSAAVQLRTSLPAGAQPQVIAPPTRPTSKPAVPAPLPSQPTPAHSPAGSKREMAVDLSRFQPHPDKAWIEVAHDDVAALIKSGALVLDARRTSVYEQGHIPGARTFSVWESDVDEKVNKLFAERGDPQEQNRPIVIYCSGGDCEDSHMLAQKLWGVQFNNAYVYKDGFPDWEKHGEPVHKGAKP